jgi:predicted O-methyltransferase YrrM
MSYQTILNTISSNRPIFDIKYGILSAPVRHCFMMGTIWYLKKNNPNLKDISILEIGSWLGASALSFAQGLKEHNNAQGKITCIDAWVPFFDEEKNADDVHKNMQAMLGSDVAYNIFMHNIGTVAKSTLCQHLRGNSENIMPMLKPEQFDVIFIDADHTYEPVKKDILNAIPLLKDGGIICGDDLNLQMFECDQELAKKSGDKDFIKDTKSGRNFHPGVTLAVDEIFGKVTAHGGFWAIQKQGTKWIAPSYKDMPVIYPDHFPAEALAKAKDHMNDIKI